MKKIVEKLLNTSCLYKEGSMADLILRNSVFYPDREAFICGDQRITFKQYNERVNRLIHALKDRGLKKGDVIGVLSWSGVEYMEIFGASEKGGFITAPINVRLSLDEIKYLINDSKARTLFIGPDLAEMADILRPDIPIVENFIGLNFSSQSVENYHDLLLGHSPDEPASAPKEDDPLFICYTSGTTGRPKGALFTHDRFREVVISHSLDVPLVARCKYMSMMPPFHIGGIMSRACVILKAATYIMLRKFDPEELVKTVAKEKVTDFSVVPTHLAMILDLSNLDDYDLNCVSRINYAGSPMPVELLKRGMEKFGPVFCQGYGATETGPDVSFLKEIDHEVLDGTEEEQARLMSCGRPALGTQVRIVDQEGKDCPLEKVGEIIVRSRHLMREYWNNPEETRKKLINGWLHTGDLGYYDRDGFIYIVDRKEDMIVSGGENIFPREVEEVLYTHPAVLECSVFGIPDTKWVEAIHAVVSLKKSMATTPEALIEFCKSGMTRFKAPKSIEIMPELPKNAAGKILKRQMKERYWKKKKKGGKGLDCTAKGSIGIGGHGHLFRREDRITD